MSNKYKQATDYLLKNDRIIADIIKHKGECTLQSNPDHFVSLIKSIISQQLSKMAANSIYSKLKNKTNIDNIDRVDRVPTCLLYGIYV